MVHLHGGMSHTCFVGSSHFCVLSKVTPWCEGVETRVFGVKTVLHENPSLDHILHAISTEFCQLYGILTFLLFFG
jgi:hypothetical protein